jgi:hypothetical protein
MMHARPHSFVRSVMWRSLGVLLVGYVSITPPAISGEMYRWVDEQGRVHLTDTPPKSKGALQEFKVYQPSVPGQAPEPSGPPVAGPARVKMTPTKPGGTVVIDAILNRRVTVPMLLDTGADFTVLTKQVARDLRLSSLDHLPTQELKTAGGRSDSRLPRCSHYVSAQPRHATSRSPSTSMAICLWGSSV